MSNNQIPISNKRIFLSVVIPAYNEEENFQKGVLKEVDEYLKKQEYSWEVIVVDDGSTDRTVALLENFVKSKKNWQLIKNPHQGKSQTVITGLKKASGQYRLFTDFDQATPIKEVGKLLEKTKDYDVVFGSREIKGAKREQEPWYRHLMGRVFNLLVQLLTVGGIHDTQCGFKLFKEAVIKEVLPKLRVGKARAKGAYTGAFDVELLFLAQKAGFKVKEVPIHWKHVKTTRVSPLKDSFKMFFEVVKIRFYDLLGIYG